MIRNAILSIKSVSHSACVPRVEWQDMSKIRLQMSIAERSTGVEQDFPRKMYSRTAYERADESCKRESDSE
jgi:hypothetical protein